MNRKKEAKDLSVKIWTWFSENPGNGKKDMPYELKAELVDFSECLETSRDIGDSDCPLCMILECSDCPVYVNNVTCHSRHSLFYNWWHNGYDTLYSKQILRHIESWEVD